MLFTREITPLHCGFILVDKIYGQHSNTCLRPTPGFFLVVIWKQKSSEMSPGPWYPPHQTCPSENVFQIGIQ